MGVAGEVSLIRRDKWWILSFERSNHNTMHSDDASKIIILSIIILHRRKLINQNFCLIVNLSHVKVNL